MNSQAVVAMLFFQLPSWAKILPAVATACTWGGCRCPAQEHRELFVCPYQLTSTSQLSAARTLAGSARRLFLTVVPAGIGSSQTCAGEVAPGGEDAGEGHSHLSSAQCCSRLCS